MRIISLIVFLSSFCLQAQKKLMSARPISDCSGAIELQNSGNFTTEFTGEKGKLNDLYAYSQLSNIKETNSLFLKFTAPTHGKLSLGAKISEGNFDLIVFKNSTGNIIDDIYYGKAKIEKSTLNPVSEILVSKDSLTPKDSIFINLKADDVILLFFNTEKGSKAFLNFSVLFEISYELANIDKLKKVVDERKSGYILSIEIQIRDTETELPVIANINIRDKNKSNLFNGSDLFFDTKKSNELTIRCDAAGYLHYEKTFKIYHDSEKVIRIPLQCLRTGTKIKIDDLQFAKGTDQIFSSAQSTLMGIRDFLLLNASIKVEIQGHVNNEGKNDRSSKSLARKRARKIRNFYRESGVNGKRLTMKSFSNKFPIYPNPKNEKESQANRRVEIKIL